MTLGYGEFAHGEDPHVDLCGWDTTTSSGYLSNFEPELDRIDRHDPILFNLNDPTALDATRTLDDVTVMFRHGGKWETAMFRGEWIEPFTKSVAIQIGGGVVHFQIRRTPSGWLSSPALRVSAWGAEALPLP